MITIKPSSGANDVPGDAPAQDGVAAAPQPEEKHKAIPLIWIPATLCLGLLIATLYLGGRILTAKSQAAPAIHAASVSKPPAPVTAAAKPPAMPESPKVAAPANAVAAVQAQPVPQAKPLAETKPAVETKPLAQAQTDGIPAAELGEDLALITPQAGQRYIQIGALGPNATRKYLAELKRNNLDLHVAPGPSPDLLRVLVGPFEDKDLLLAVQARLDAAGILNFIRKY